MVLANFRKGTESADAAANANNLPHDVLGWNLLARETLPDIMKDHSELHATNIP